jgi:hypothetical protein
LSILQVLTGEVLLSLCLLILPCVGSETRGWEKGRGRNGRGS